MVEFEGEEGRIERKLDLRREGHKLDIHGRGTSRFSFTSEGLMIRFLKYREEDVSVYSRSGVQ